MLVGSPTVAALAEQVRALPDAGVSQLLDQEPGR
jgi:hypothetical protein